MRQFLAFGLVSMLLSIAVTGDPANNPYPKDKKVPVKPIPTPKHHKPTSKPKPTRPFPEVDCVKVNDVLSQLKKPAITSAAYKFCSSYLHLPTYTFEEYVFKTVTDPSLPAETVVDYAYTTPVPTGPIVFTEYLSIIGTSTIDTTIYPFWTGTTYPPPASWSTHTFTITEEVFTEITMPTTTTMTTIPPAPNPLPTIAATRLSSACECLDNPFAYATVTITTTETHAAVTTTQLLTLTDYGRIFDAYTTVTAPRGSDTVTIPTTLYPPTLDKTVTITDTYMPTVTVFVTGTATKKPKA